MGTHNSHRALGEKLVSSTVEKASPFVDFMLPPTLCTDCLVETGDWRVHF